VSNFAQIFAGQLGILFHALNDPSKAAQQRHREAAGRNPMNYAEPRCRVYDPNALTMMGRAFDKAVKGLSPEAKTDPNIRQKLARCILRLFDEGERVHLAIIALSIVDGRWHVSKERIAPFYPIGALIPSGTDRRLAAA
jgi:hypothetical protein